MFAIPPHTLIFFPLTLSPSLPLPPLCSPCGKKFRSKPQIARFLGDAADLSVFDFSRAGTPGDGSSRRRARDRSTRRAVEIKQGPPPVRPLTINPLRPSGPIRRTCGVIKLPVTWVPALCDDKLKLLVKQELPMEIDETPQPAAAPSNPSSVPAPTAPVAAPSATAPPAVVNGAQNQQNPTEQPPQSQLPQPQPQQTLPPAPPKPKAVVMVPALWENRLRGVMAYDFETGDEIKINPEKLATQNGLSHSSSNGEPKEGQVTLDKAALTALLNKQLIQQVTKIEDKKIVPGSMSAGNIVPSLLAHGRNVPKQQGVLAPLIPSLKTIKENGSLIATPQQSNLAGGGNIVLTLPTMASASAYTKSSGVGGIGSLTQPKNIRSAIGHKPAASSVSQGLYVSDSEVRRQEERVQMIRKQLMAAQSTV